MKFLILAALLGYASAQVLLSAPAPLVSTGQSSQYRTQDNVGNYAFGYNEDHSTGGTFRREAGNAAGQVVGSYGLRDADGRIRTVNYVADDAGFRAAIATNEPGVEPKDPADVSINKPAALVAAPIVAAPAPIIAAPAPIAVAAAAPAPLIAPAPLWAPQQVVAAPVAAQQYWAPQQVVASAPLWAPSQQIVTAPHQVATVTTTTQHVGQPILQAAPLAARLALPAAPLVNHAPLVNAPVLANNWAISNIHAPAASWGYTLGLPPTFGFSLVKKK